MKRMGLYLHIPFCMKKCLYCDFLSFVEDEKRQNAYIKAMRREIAFYGDRYEEYVVPTVYIGGGTPSWLKENAIVSILNEVKRSFTILPDAEITIECNPGTVTEHKFIVYKELGINRLSIGLQSANDWELRRLGRVHNFAQFLRTYELARKCGFSNINIDLMSGLPGQGIHDYRATLQKILPLKPEHISAYSLMIEEGTPFFELYGEDAKRQSAGLEPKELPTEETVCRMTELTDSMLKKAGYMHYEISNYALKDRVCRHNIGYWKRENYLGLGLGAASLIENVRYANISDLHEYIGQAESIQKVKRQEDAAFVVSNLHEAAEKISRKAQMEEFMFLGLRMTEGILREDFKYYFGVPIEAVYQEVLSDLDGEGLLVRREGRIFLTRRGQEVSNYVLARFLI